MFVVKWFTVNFLGTNMKHLVDRRCAWFLHTLRINKLDCGLCSCQTIVHSLDGITKAKSMSLPFLLTKIRAFVNNLNPGVNDHVRLPPNRHFALF